MNEFFFNVFKSKIFIFLLRGKHRFTIIECGCDINMMIDLAKGSPRHIKAEGDRKLGFYGRLVC